MAAWSVLTPEALGLCGLWGFFAKLGSDNLTPKSAAVVQGMGAAVVAFIVLAFMRFRPDRDTGGSTAALFAGVSLMAGISAFVIALSHGGKASIVVPITAIYPVITIALSVGILKE